MMSVCSRQSSAKPTDMSGGSVGCSFALSESLQHRPGLEGMVIFDDGACASPGPSA